METPALSIGGSDGPSRSVRTHAKRNKHGWSCRIVTTCRSDARFVKRISSIGCLMARTAAGGRSEICPGIFTKFPDLWAEKQSGTGHAMQSLNGAVWRTDAEPYRQTGHLQIRVITPPKIARHTCKKNPLGLIACKCRMSFRCHTISRVVRAEAAMLPQRPGTMTRGRPGIAGPVTAFDPPSVPPGVQIRMPNRRYG